MKNIKFHYLTPVIARNEAICINPPHQFISTLAHHQIFKLVFLFLTFYFITLQTFNSFASANITISFGAKFVISSNAVLSVPGNLTVNGTFTASGTSTIKFCGTALQQIGGSSGVSTFQNVEFNNAANFKLLGDVTVNGATTLTNGIVSTGTKTLILVEAATFSPATGSLSSFIDGKIKKTGNNVAFTFPVGDIQGGINYWAPLDMGAFDNTNSFTVQSVHKSTNDSLGIHTWQDGASLGAGLDHVSGKEFWYITQDIGSTHPAVTLYWEDADNSGIAHTGVSYDDLTDLTLVHWNSGTSKWDNMGGTATTPLGYPTGQITNATAFSSYSPITFGSKTGKNPLPIELLSFTATCIPPSPLGEGSGVRLNWQTASETNNNNFTIEKSIDAINWTAINNIAGQGNSNQLQNYDVTVTPSEVEGEVEGYYRLKQTDFDGAFTYSDVIQTSCHDAEINLINIFPNPAHDFFSYVICSNEDREIKIKVEDVLGQVLIRRTETIIKGINNKIVDVSKLAPAAYYFSIATTDGTHCENKQILIK